VYGGPFNFLSAVEGQQRTRSLIQLEKASDSRQAVAPVLGIRPCYCEHGSLRYSLRGGPREVGLLVPFVLPRCNILPGPHFHDFLRGSPSLGTSCIIPIVIPATAYSVCDNANRAGHRLLP